MCLSYIIALPLVVLLFESNSELVATLTLARDFPLLSSIDDINDQWPPSVQAKKGNNYLHGAQNLRDKWKGLIPSNDLKVCNFTLINCVYCSELTVLIA
jgi:hypothetical protein